LKKLLPLAILTLLAVVGLVSYRVNWLSNQPAEVFANKAVPDGFDRLKFEPGVVVYHRLGQPGYVVGEKVAIRTDSPMSVTPTRDGPMPKLLIHSPGQAVILTKGQYTVFFLDPNVRGEITASAIVDKISWAELQARLSDERMAKLDHSNGH
jgi:hypothetical protein